MHVLSIPIRLDIFYLKTMLEFNLSFKVAKGVQAFGLFLNK